MNNEIWKPVLHYEGYYEVSNFGRVRSIDRLIIQLDGRKRLYKGKVLNPRNKCNKEGNYLTVNLKRDSIGHTKFVHKLVAEVFVSNPNNLPFVNHIDENKLNNLPENLEWCTAEYNANYGSRNARILEGRIKCGYVNPEMVGLGKDYGRIYREKRKQNEIQSKN